MHDSSLEAAAWTSGYRPPAAALARPADQSWDALLVCVAVYLVASIGRIHEIYPALAPFKPALSAGVLGAGLYILSGDPNRQLGPVLRAPTTRCLLGLLIWVVLSMPGALWPGGTFQLLTDVFFKTVPMYLILAGAVRGVRDVERLAGVYLVSAILYSVAVLNRFQVGEDSWRLSTLYYYDANDFATFAVTAIPLGLYFTIDRRSWILRGMAALGTTALCAAFVRSGSRGGFLALAAIGLFVLARYTTVSLRWRVLGLAIITTVVVGSASDRYWDQMRTIIEPKDDYNMTGEAGRIEIWRRGIGYMLQHPFLGVGGSNFNVAEFTNPKLAEQGAYGRGVRWGAPHNIFVQVGAELGVPGLLWFVGLFVTALIALRRVARAQPPPGESGESARRLSQSLTGSLIGFIVGGFFLSLAYADIPYLLAALAVALHKTTARPFGPVSRGGARIIQGAHPW